MFSFSIFKSLSYSSSHVPPSASLRKFRSIFIISKGTMASDAPSRADCERIFKRMDKNGDGKISLEEFTNAVKALGSSSQVDIPTKMKEIDKDGDGFISLDELWEFFCAHPQILKEASNKV